jgi:FkbM family methyltransferase
MLGVSSPVANLSLNKPALQSSISHWSVGRTIEQDAMGANNGDISCDTGFQTARELAPWWQVDLQDEFLIRAVLLFNRRYGARRLRYFSILKSLDGQRWDELFRKRDGSVFGENNDLPYVADISGDRLARFVRVRLDGLDCLHFRECQVFGCRPDPGLRERLIGDEARVDRARLTIPEGRRGNLLNVDGFTLFVDRDNYEPSIASALESGAYESRECQLVKTLIQPGDRIIEVGTGVGLVSMTAASIAGAHNVLTFDANPDIIADAQSNFHRNDLQGIQSRLGILKNCQTFLGMHEMVDFYIAKAFWASRLNASERDPDIVKKVKIPVFCFEDEILSHKANVLICDIEGGEVELIMNANLAGIKTIIMETHYWSVGEAAVDTMMRKLILDGFAIHLGHSGQHVTVLRR